MARRNNIVKLEKAEPHLGQWVSFKHTLRRVSEYGNKSGEWRKKWIREKGEERQGIVVGIRHLTNGTNKLVSGGVIYEHQEFLIAYLVAYDLKRKHALVLEKDAQELVGLEWET